MQIKDKVLFAGFGGQGILAAGKIFADSCIDNGLNASWLPSYGMEMRGGTSNCQVVASNEEIASPIFTRPTCMIVMNQASMDRFEPRMVNTRLAIVNSGLVTVPEETLRAHAHTRFVTVDATGIALSLGSVRCANMVMLGAYARFGRMLTKEQLKSSLQKIFAKKASSLEMNLAAIDKGYEAATER